MENNRQSTIFSSKKTAILVDLSFFIKTYKKSQGTFSAPDLAKRLRDYVFKSLGFYNDTIYRVYIYDCEPISEGRVIRPISKTEMSMQETQAYIFRTELLNELKEQPLFAIRLGKISGRLDWKLKAAAQKDLLSGKKTWDTLTDDDFALDIKQKGVDMRIGLDIASLSIKKQVEKIILIAGDSDFVPAVKMARREGIVVQLDPMRHQKISKELLEHVDLKCSILPASKD